MREAMRRCKAIDRMIVAHCEVDALLDGGYIHKGQYAALHGHRGISSESEWKEIERDIRLVAQTGCRFHVCHISTKESVQLIREAKRAGLPVTCETAPHYLLLHDGLIGSDYHGTTVPDMGWWKMNPPIRSEADRDALIEGALDGTIDVIATDHAPHAAEEKMRGLEKSAFGIVGLETAFPLLYTYLVKTGVMSMDRLVEMMSLRPRQIMGLDVDDFVQFDLDQEWVIDSERFLSLGKATPFNGWSVAGKCITPSQI